MNANNNNGTFVEELREKSQYKIIVIRKAFYDFKTINREYRK